MKEAMKTAAIFITLLTGVASSVLADPPAKVNFRMSALDDTAEPEVMHRCWFNDILKYRKGDEASSPRVATIVLSKETAWKPESFDFCQNVFTNLTGLDRQEVRDEIAGILSEMPCAPDKELSIKFGSTKNPEVRKKNPAAKHNHIINRINITGCQEDMPNLCSFPSAITSWDSRSVIIDYKKMMTAFKDCRDALVQKAKEKKPSP